MSLVLSLVSAHFVSQGALLKRHSGHSLLAINCLCLFFIVGAVPSCSSIYQVFGLYLCAGVCLGLNNGLTNTLITWVHAGRNGASPQSVALLQLLLLHLLLLHLLLLHLLLLHLPLHAPARTCVLEGNRGGGSRCHFRTTFG